MLKLLLDPRRLGKLMTGKKSGSGGNEDEDEQIDISMEFATLASLHGAHPPSFDSLSHEEREGVAVAATLGAVLLAGGDGVALLRYGVWVCERVGKVDRVKRELLLALENCSSKAVAVGSGGGEVLLQELEEAVFKVHM